MQQIYGYKCGECGQQYDSYERGDRLFHACDYCGDTSGLRRVFMVSLQRPMQEHFNQSLQMPISDMKQFTRELTKKGDQMMEYTGIESRYEPVDLSDTKGLGVTAEGLDATNRIRRAEGRPTISLKGL